VNDFPRTFNEGVPNQVLSSTSGRCAAAARTRAKGSKRGLGGMVLSMLLVLG